MSVVLETTLGDITVDLFTDERPRTSLNFLKLCKMKYYNFCLFHKIQRNFMAQTGDPTGTGRGGESVFATLYGDQAKYFETETKPKLRHANIGTLSMVNNGDDLLGSQFFLTLGENLDYIDDKHCVFGEIAEGIEILMKINDAICDEKDRPYQDIRITHTVVLDDPFDDPQGFVVPDRSPEPTSSQLNSGRIAADEEIDDTKGKTLDEIEEEIQDKEAKARATILEMVGDIPDVDVKPPDNVLFVCKLNPVTTAEDLEVIFSRFGKILSCEVIKDKQSSESLQYAFIEFDKMEDCENAYFKMDNVLIDDRRIHVDFSQSVAKYKWQDYQKHMQNKQKNNLILKETVGQRQGKNYDMVFDDTGPEVQVKKRSRKHSHSKERSQRKPPKYEVPERMEVRRDSWETKRYRSRSRSRSPGRKRDFRQFQNYRKPHYVRKQFYQNRRPPMAYRQADNGRYKNRRYESPPNYYKEKYHSEKRKQYRSRNRSSTSSSDDSRVGNKTSQRRTKSSSSDSDEPRLPQPRNSTSNSDRELPRSYGKDRCRRSSSLEREKHHKKKDRRDLYHSSNTRDFERKKYRRSRS